MADFRAATAARQAMGDAGVGLIDAGTAAGKIKIYSGTKPASVNDVVSGDSLLLAELTMNDPAFGATGTDGVATAGAITGDSSADNTGDAAYFRVEDSNGTAIFQGDVTATGGGGDLELSSVSIQAGVEVNMTSFTVTVPEV